MTISLTTPAMLFPAVSLLLLAYTNRFVTLASIIRNFDPEHSSENTKQQINNLRRRIYLIRRMQEAGVVSFFLCVVSMLALYWQYVDLGGYIFAASLGCLLYSLYLSVREINISCDALDVHLKNFKVDFKHRKKR
ncbi:DUF2721 domain-containing protein [Marinomonas piezotolerans]|uniref:DUF2721 domain-containing protein n=1 Tax=Marinomonas piezotolerans TaxID=2213058 RepID=A0A370U7N9_9GAMM|nr:DUF2721 domain-containing protein [Marinomonas piezotolerans]RDL43810.1 DUF2721 domain-containing protein [Marinomonas piezotolerans]